MSEREGVGGGLLTAIRFARGVRHRFHRDEGFLMTAAIAWGLLFALIPFLALGVGLTGFVLSAKFEDPAEAVVTLFARGFPQGGAGMDFTQLLQTLVGEVMATRTGLTLVGSLVFVWLASSLSESLRNALGRVFELGARRGFLAGKVFDVVTVLVGVVLVTLNLGITVVVTAVMDFGLEVLPWSGRTLPLAQRFVGFAVAFASIWVLFVIAYRYLPARRTAWRTTFVAATFAGLAHETLKIGFSWYLTEVANYTSTLGNLATIAVLFIWIYYGALVFILGGEVAHEYAMRTAAASEPQGMGLGT